MKLEGYSKEDIVQVLQRVYDETEQNRNMALKLYNHMEAAMMSNKGDLFVLSQMADRWLEQSSRQTEMLVRLAGVMQKLKQFGGEGDGKLLTDVNQLLEALDRNKVTPFTIGGKDGKKTEKIENRTEKAPDVSDTTGDASTSGDIQLTAEL